MEYEQFYAEYTNVSEAVMAGLSLDALTMEIGRLRQLVDRG
ncbi:hypothetical protein EV644_107317 [Kribbella orskensis]|uniref:Uncharacterized protein n=1 Tax=Kribbella orskensis TaxID=2512216 RepID=A0ABY2BJ87_9ACTN|nr:MULTISPECIES: hypothetical protein [Kribbella]TCN39345.1 hypothetical protein EV642_107317 [Kribbella sp. VKM Ac-2500]TCO21992.1 hypothetical protein EV644_107317 [Kribbella orskensis]